MFVFRTPRAPLSQRRGHRPAGGHLPGRPVLPPELAARARPVVSAAARLLPLPAPLVPLFGDGALRRGGTTVVAGPLGRGATTLALSLLAAASAEAGWAAAVGLTDPGVVAAAELGLDLRRVVFVPRPRGGWADAAAELLDGVDVVLVRPFGRARGAAARHLVARARERRSALVVLAERPGDWPVGADVTLSVTAAEWCGVSQGHGHLLGRRAQVEATGRRSASRVRTRVLWLPTGSGVLARWETGDEHDGGATASDTTT